MKKLSKILLSPMPIIAALPAIGFVTSCAGDVDYDQIKAWFDATLESSKNAYAESGKATDSLTIGLEELAAVEQSFINNKVVEYANRAISNLRKEMYNEQEFDIYYGTTYEERSSLFIPLKEQKIAENKWVIVDEAKPELGYIKDNLPNSSGGVGHEIQYYHLISGLSGYIAKKGESLCDLAGWASSLVLAAIDIKNGDTTLSSWTNQLLRADADAANIGHLFLNSKEKYKSPSIAMYEYYTNLKSDKERFATFYFETLGLNLYWEESKKINTIFKRINNFYFVSYLTEKTELKYDETAKAYFEDAIRYWLRKMELIIKY